MNEIFVAGASGLTYTQADYCRIVDLYRSGMSLSGITHDYADKHKGCCIGYARIIVDHAIFRYLDLYRKWTHD